jgi:hypothetical protein
MNQNKSPLNEIASGADAIKTARAEPLQKAESPRQTMDFIRSLVLDLPIQSSIEVAETPTALQSRELDAVKENEDLASIKKLAGIR